MRDSIVIYRSHFESVFGEIDDPDTEDDQFFTNIQKAEFLEKYLRYAFYGEEPSFSGLLKRIFTPMRPQIDSNNYKFENGKKGGRPKKNTAKTYTETNKETTAKTNGFEKAKPPWKPNDNDNDHVNANENVIIDCLSDSHTDESDGQSDKEKLFLLDVIQSRIESEKYEDILKQAEWAAHGERFKSLAKRVAENQTEKIGERNVPTLEVLNAFLDLLRTPEQLGICFGIIDSSKCKNKYGYSVSVLYNHAKGF